LQQTNQSIDGVKSHANDCNDGNTKCEPSKSAFDNVDEKIKEEKKDKKSDQEENSPGDNELIEKITSFDNMNLSEDLLRGIYGKGFEKPSVVQSMAIVPLSQGRDCVVQAQSGTGKTGAFAIGTLARVDASLREPQILVLEPVRELARQTAGVYRELSTRMGVYVACITGGTSFQTNRKLLRSSQIVVCTPGRLIDCLRRGWMRLDRVRMLVLDEADEMLSHGFVDDMRDIVRDVPPDCQIGVFSATFQPESLDLCSKFVRNPVRLLLQKETLTLAGILQFYVAVGDDRFKSETLADLYGDVSASQSVVFCATRRRVDALCDFLSAQQV